MTVEAVVDVLVDTMGHGICRACHARIIWYTSVGGKPIAFDGAPTLHNVHRDQTRIGSPWVAEIARTSVHWSTCPDADSFRRRGRAS